MKKLCVMLLCLGLIVSLAACAAPAPQETQPATTEAPDRVYTYEMGFSLQLPGDFRQQQSKRNDFYGTGDDGAYGVIANKQSKDGFLDLKDYARSVAQANQAGEPIPDGQGKYVLSYQSDGNCLHTVFAEGEEAYYRVVFYCPQANWDYYRDSFPQWAATVTVE